jgi:6-pyruvoyltetrahydropterin/6-carboxytetrahydropterin synthase
MQTMAPRYTVSCEIGFSASHALTGYEGGCASVHGHNWVVRVYYEFDQLDDHGFTIDYQELKRRLAEVVLPNFDHRHLNDFAPFDTVNPTSENIAAEIFKLCRDRIQPERGRLVEVELWETPTDMVRYRE